MRTTTYACPICEADVEFVCSANDPSGANATCPDCGAHLRVEWDYDGNSEGWHDCSTVFEVDAKEGE